MSAAVCIYELSLTVDAAIDVVCDIADQLRLNSDSLEVQSSDVNSPARFRISRTGQNSSIKLPAGGYTISISECNINTATLSNSGSYIVCWSSKSGVSLVFYSELDRFEEFAKRATQLLFPIAIGKFGFAIDWREKSSFWAYAAGFQDMTSLRGDLLGETPAGRWGVLYRSRPDFFDDGHFRDIYPLNLISLAHLSREIHGATVRDLIHGDVHKFGIVSELAKNWYSWAVPSKNLDIVRREFRLGGLLD